MYGIVGGKSKVKESRVLYHAEGKGSSPRPLPPMLWLDQPGWRGILDGHLHANMTDFILSFTYEHRSGVNAELAARVKKFGLLVGGEFRKSHAVAFNLVGKLPPLAVSNSGQQTRPIK
jgi:hypothetical protein